MFKIYYINYKNMNIKLLRDKWRKYYKRGFITGVIVLCFLCLIDQTLQSTFFFNKIDSLSMLLLTLSFILFGAVFCGLVSLLILLVISFVTVYK